MFELNLNGQTQGAQLWAESLSPADCDPKHILCLGAGHFWVFFNGILMGRSLSLLNTAVACDSVVSFSNPVITALVKYASLQ